jgi:predicted acyl esterase
MTAGFQELARQWALSGEWDLLQQWLRPASPLVFVDRIRCPVFILHGWHDVGMPPNEVVALFERLRVPKKLYFGGGGHDGQDQGTVLEYREALVERWLDHWLKSKDTGILEEAPVSCALRPGWDHTQVSDLSAAASGELALYLRAGGRLDAEAPSGPELPANVNNFRTDPSYGLAEALRDDMAGVPAALTREEVVYEGEPLEQDWIILGAPRASLCLLSNRPAFQIHVELYDVDPQGQTPILISRGHWGTRAATPGHHLRVEIETATIHYRLPAGHRLRAVMTNYNTTFAYPTFEVACTRLYHELGRASVVRLPLMGRATCEDVVAKGEAGS